MAKRSLEDDTLQVSKKIAQDLPPETLMLVFGYLDVQSLCRIAQVSRFWRELAEDDSLWIRIRTACILHGTKKLCRGCSEEIPRGFLFVEHLFLYHRNLTLEPRYEAVKIISEKKTDIKKSCVEMLQVFDDVDEELSFWDMNIEPTFNDSDSDDMVERVLLDVEIIQPEIELDESFDSIFDLF
jgi:F-box-like